MSKIGPNSAAAKARTQAPTPPAPVLPPSDSKDKEPELKDKDPEKGKKEEPQPPVPSKPEQLRMGAAQTEQQINAMKLEVFELYQKLNITTQSVEYHQKQAAAIQAQITAKEQDIQNAQNANVVQKHLTDFIDPQKDQTTPAV